MAETLFNVVYKGKILEGFDLNQVTQNVVKVFKISEKRAAQIVKSKQTILKKNLDMATAKRYKATLAQAGLHVDLKIPEPESIQVEQPVTDTPSPAQTASPDQQVAEEAATEEPGEPNSFEFKGAGSDYFSIWIVNILLSIVTLGIYSAWAKVRKKQFFYGHTKIRGASFEYLAKPINILKGRAIVFGIFVVYSLISKFLPILGGILSIAFVIILPWLIVRSLVFNARNSSLRNIRFGFSGKVSQAAKVFVLWPILTPFTLGILAPFVYFKQKSFVVKNTKYGTTHFTFSATPGDYYRIFFSVSLYAIGGLIIAAIASFLFQPLIIIISLVLYLYIFAFITVKTSNLIYNSTNLHVHGFYADMDVKEYAWIVFTNSIFTALTIGFYHPWASVRALKYKVAHLSLIPGRELDNFIASEQKQVSALGEEMADFFDIDFGL